MEEHKEKDKEPTSTNGAICTKPFSQPRDAARLQGEMKSGQEKFMSGGGGYGKKVLLGAPKMDFMRLRNNPTLLMILVEISIEIIFYRLPNN